MILDFGVAAWEGNRILDPLYAARLSGAEFLPLLSSECRARGITVQTRDVFLATTRAECQAVRIVGHAWTDSTAFRCRGRDIPVICVCMESPVVAYQFYADIQRYSRAFRHAFVFRGARSRLEHSRVTVHDLNWPVVSENRVRLMPWSQRGFCTLVNANKRPFGRSLLLSIRRPLLSSLSFWRWLTVPHLRRSDPWFSRELYTERLAVIAQLASSPGFDLFGRGWSERGSPVDPEYRDLVGKCYRGELAFDAKLMTLSGYRFAVCFENCAFPGYLTEKLFDCLLAGCIPVYLGDPSVTERVPKDCFIDARDFADYAELETFLREMSESEASTYLQAAGRFLTSPSFSRFTREALVAELVESIEESFVSIGAGGAWS